MRSLAVVAGMKKTNDHAAENRQKSNAKKTKKTQQDPMEKQHISIDKCVNLHTLIINMSFNLNLITIQYSPFVVY